MVMGWKLNADLDRLVLMMYFYWVSQHFCLREEDLMHFFNSLCASLINLTHNHIS